MLDPAFEDQLTHWQKTTKQAAGRFYEDCLKCLMLGAVLLCIRPIFYNIVLTYIVSIVINILLSYILFYQHDSKN